MALQTQLRSAAQASFAALPTPEFERDHLRDWNFIELPTEVNFTRNGMRLRGYPALIAEKDGSLALRVLDSPTCAKVATRAGLWRLIGWQIGPAFKPLAARPTPFPADDLALCRFRDATSIARGHNERSPRSRFLSNGLLQRDQEAFAAVLECGKARLAAARIEVFDTTDAILAAYHEVWRILAGELSPVWAEAVADIRDQLAWLVYPGFLSETLAEWLSHLPRYLQAIALRLQ